MKIKIKWRTNSKYIRHNERNLTWTWELESQMNIGNDEYLMGNDEYLIAPKNLCFDEWFSNEKITCKYHYSAYLL